MNLRLHRWTPQPLPALLAAMLIISGLAWSLILVAAPVSWTGLAVVGVALAAPLYLVGHGLRALRLVVITGEASIPPSDLASLHLLTSGTSRLVPWKLGEIYRLYELARLLADPLRAVVVIWLERLFDTGAILLTLGLLRLFLPHQPLRASEGLLVGLALAFLFASGVLFLVVPENLAALQRWLIRRRTGPLGLRVLRGSHHLHRSLDRAGHQLRRNWATMAWLTAAIWLCEIAVAALLVHLLLDGGRAHAAQALFGDTVAGAVPWQHTAAATAVGSLPPLLVAVYTVATLDALLAAALLVPTLWLRRRRRLEGRTGLFASNGGLR